ncbi:class II fructose-bisphosphate aldolase [Patescibacteria group bacterium]|nr:class II fructose-bisphosphate aldolase [Patescibacteria group bacterium]MBU1890937.1 class II fructose-bisphosphate aldolase [Patescibacteria group bacterium]
MLITSDFIIEKAKKENYGIGCFINYNLETVLATAQAAVEMRSPIIIGISEFTIAYTGVHTIAKIVKSIAENQAVSIPIALHLDHGRSLESVKAALEAGFTSIQIDGSHLPFEKNIDLTQKVIRHCHQKKIWVEGELGAIYGGHGDSGVFKGDVPLVKPEEVLEYIEQTEVDMLAPALGTIHGKFKNEKIHFDLIKKIKLVTDIPLVLHGASGLPNDEITRAVKEGVTKVNIGTETKNLFVDSIKDTLKKHPEVNGPRSLMTPTVEAIKKMIKEKIKMLGSANKI